MRLDSITLHGFKSFGERTELRILPERLRQEQHL